MVNSLDASLSVSTKPAGFDCHSECAEAMVAQDSVDQVFGRNQDFIDQVNHTIAGHNVECCDI